MKPNCILKLLLSLVFVLLSCSACYVPQPYDGPELSAALASIRKAHPAVRIIMIEDCPGSAVRIDLYAKKCHEAEILSIMKDVREAVMSKTVQESLIEGIEPGYEPRLSVFFLTAAFIWAISCLLRQMNSTPLMRGMRTVIRAGVEKKRSRKNGSRRIGIEEQTQSKKWKSRDERKQKE